MSLLLALGLVGKDSKSEIAPAVFARCLERCGPTFVKLGQWIATRRDFLSDAACQRLSQLHMDVSATFDVEEEELRRRLAFSGLDLLSLDCAEPLGAGCVSQVYKGELGSGLEVAVKLRRPRVRQQVALDVALLRLLAARAERVWTDLRWLSLQEAVGAFGHYMEEQLDFRREAQNLLRFRANFARHKVVKVPEVHHQEEDLLITTLIGGRSLAELLGGSASELGENLRVKLWEVLGKMVSKMIFEDNFVHQDLHPGNIRVTLPGASSAASSALSSVSSSASSSASSASPAAAAQLVSTWAAERLPEGSRLRGAVEWASLSWPFGKAPFEIHLLDAGIAIQVTEQKRAFFADVVRHAVMGQVEAAGAAFLAVHEALGLADLAVAKERFTWAIGSLASGAVITRSNWEALGFATEEEYKQSRLGHYFAKMAQLFSEHRIRMDHEIWALLTSFALIEGSMHELNGSNNVLRCVLPYVCGPGSLMQGLRCLMRSESASATS